MGTLKDLIPILQIAIGPVILISGIGLVLLNMTNRFARVIDRSRILSRELDTSDEEHKRRVFAQVQILTKRAILLRRAITLAVLSALLAAILIIALFLAALLRLEAAWVMAFLFSACMASLIGALVTFLQDINESLLALKLELSDLPVSKI